MAINFVELASNSSNLHFTVSSIISRLSEPHLCLLGYSQPLSWLFVALLFVSRAILGLAFLFESLLNAIGLKSGLNLLFKVIG